MIRLGLRLTLNGGRESLFRLVVTAAAVALGVAMLLITLAGINAVNSQNGRYAWFETGAGSGPGAAPAQAGVDPVWWRLTADVYHGKIIGRVDVAVTGPHSPVPPGLPRLPAAGEYYASPAMAELLRATPAAQLGERYPGKAAGTIGDAGLPAPNSLVIVVGHTPAEIQQGPGATQVSRISTTAPSSCNGACYFVGIDANGIDLILSVAAAAMLFPVLIFIGTATRLSAARREQRFAAMRLVGATPAQVSVISAVESTVAATAGVAVGFGLFFLVRPLLAPIPFTGDPFYLSDLSLNAADVVLVALGVPVAAAVAARLALRRVQITPLGVTRRVTPRPPRAWRLVPLVAGLAELAYFVAVGRPQSTAGQTQAYLTGFLIAMAGLVIAGPWLTMTGSRLMARRTDSPAVLIAGRRLSDNPKAGFRAISGLILAIFVGTVAVGVIATMNAYDTGSADPAADRATLVDDFPDFGPGGPPSRALPSLPAPLVDELRAIPGVRAVTAIRKNPAVLDERGPTPGLVSCAELANTPALGRCPAGAGTAATDVWFGGRSSHGASTVWPAGDLPAERLRSLPVILLAVGTDGSTAAIEQVRTVLERAYPAIQSPMTISEDGAQSRDAQLNAQFQRLADVVILASLVIAGCSLAASVVAGLSDRKRPFSLLRLTGAPLGMLRRVVALETAVPLLLIALLSAATGFVAAGLFLRAQLDETLRPPGTGYFLVLAAGLVTSLGIVALTLPLLDRITGPDTARNE